jgi:hypothetical protein
MKKIAIFFLKTLKLVIKDIVSISKLTKNEFFDAIEILSFGLVINAIYGITSKFNTHDFFIILICLYIILKVKKERRS